VCPVDIYTYFLYYVHLAGIREVSDCMNAWSGKLPNRVRLPNGGTDAPHIHIMPVKYFLHNHVSVLTRRLKKWRQ
jgi:hypothetical protein